MHIEHLLRESDGIQMTYLSIVTPTEKKFVNEEQIYPTAFKAIGSDKVIEVIIEPAVLAKIMTDHTSLNYDMILSALRVQFSHYKLVLLRLTDTSI